MHYWIYTTFHDNVVNYIITQHGCIFLSGWKCIHKYKRLFKGWHTYKYLMNRMLSSIKGTWRTDKKKFDWWNVMPIHLEGNNILRNFCLLGIKFIWTSLVWKTATILLDAESKLANDTCRRIDVAKEILLLIRTNMQDIRANTLLLMTNKFSKVSKYCFLRIH